MKEFAKLEKWSVAVWVATALLSATLLFSFSGTMRFIDSWPEKVVLIVWPFAACYSLWLLYRAKKDRLHAICSN